MGERDREFGIDMYTALYLKWITNCHFLLQCMKVKSESEVARLSATPWTAAYQALPSMGFSRQEYWSGVPLPSPTRTYYLAQGTLLTVMWQPGWEGSLGENGYMYMYG